MIMTENKLRRIIKSVIKESVDIQSHKDRVIDQFSSDSFRWSRFSRSDFYQMAEGEDAYGVRGEYYAGWSDQDFIDVIIAVDGEYEP